MAALFSFGILLVISIVVMVLATIIGLFANNIILFESIGMSIAAGCLAGHFWQIHPAFCILIGIGALFGLYNLMKTKFGFWTIGGLMSLLWGFVVAIIVYDSTGRDAIWLFVSWGLVTAGVLALHIKAKNSVT